MLKRLAPLSWLLASWLFPTSALADTFPISDRGIRFDVFTWDGRTCVITPQQPDSSSCTPSDLARRPAPVGNVGVAGYAVVHYPGWDMTLLVTVADVPTFADDEPDEMRPMARQAVRDALPAGARLISDGIDEGIAFQRSNDAPFLRLTPTIETTLPSGVEGTAATVEYVVFSGRGVYSVGFAADAAHASDVAKVADNAFASLLVSRLQRHSFRLGRLAVFGSLLGGIIALLVWLRTRERELLVSGHKD